MRGESLLWFKTNLRLLDNPLLELCHQNSAAVDHLFIFDPRNFQSIITRLDDEKTDSSSKYSFLRFKFLCESVSCLNSSLKQRGSSLNMFLGYPEEVIPALAKDTNNFTLYCQQETQSEELSVCREVYERMEHVGGRVVADWTGDTLIDPRNSKITTMIDNLGHFTAFRKEIEGSSEYLNKTHILATPEWTFDSFKGPRERPATCSSTSSIHHPTPTPVYLGDEHYTTMENFDTLVSSLYDEIGRSIAPNSTFEKTPCYNSPSATSAFPFHGGETAGLNRLRSYVDETKGDHSPICSYKQTRNGLIGADYSTKFSPYLSLGCLSPKTIAKQIYSFEDKTDIRTDSTYFVIFELLWRDYFRFYGKRFGDKLFHLGGPQGEAGHRKHPWGRDKCKLDAWRNGCTGYPFIDANMRELCSTGFMSNRGRQVVASFLVRDLGLDWRLGAMHFETFLLDHDVSSNYGNWQYSAGVGSDPRDDRYFNIIKQTRMYDPSCAYIRMWLPDIAHLPDEYLVDPRLLTADLREHYGLGVSPYRFHREGQGGGSTETPGQGQRDSSSPSTYYPPPIADLIHGFFDEKKMNKALSKKKKAKKTFHGDIPGITVEQEGTQS